MNFNKAKILEIVRQQLALDMNCKAQDFLCDGIVFCESGINEGRRMFERQTPYLEIATMGKGIVVSADPEILLKIKPFIEEKSREDLFFNPFIYGHSLYYIPDCKSDSTLQCPGGFTYHIKEGQEIHELYEIPGFGNAIQYDKNHARPDGLVIYAMKGDEIVGMAGASIDSQTMCQIGIDVIPAFRGVGLAAYLVRKLTEMILERGVVPYYGTASSNIPSQAVAYRSGFIPAWMCTYKNIFDGQSPFGHISSVNLGS